MPHTCCRRSRSVIDRYGTSNSWCEISCPYHRLETDCSDWTHINRQEMKGLCGCLSLIGATSAGFFIFAVYDRWTTTYMDRDEAIAASLAEVKRHCREEGSHPEICGGIRTYAVEEFKDGWNLDFETVDGRRCETVFIGRQGEFQALRRSWDETDRDPYECRVPSPSPSHERLRARP